MRRQALQLAARYAGRHPKTFETALTAMTLECAYYHCPRCRQGFYPRDRALGMARSGLSPAVTRITGATAALVSFARASGLLADLAGVFPCEPPAAVTMYLGMDGTGVPMRPTEVAGRAGKQADGSAKTCEAKLVLVWTAEDRDKHGHPRCDAGSVTYSAAIESAASRDTDPDPSEFAWRVRREAERRGFQLARRRVILGDGAKWIWQVATEMFPGAIQIVDYFHACEKVWQVARALGGGKCAAYIERNRDRMRYPDFRAQGLQIGSGVVEGGCKNVVGGRLKQSGMRWTKDGADAILALRCCVLSGRYEDFWQWRSDPAPAAAV